MDNNDSAFETLKEILRHIRYPDELNDHAWTRSLFGTADLARAAGVPPGRLSFVVGLRIWL